MGSLMEVHSTQGIILPWSDPSDSAPKRKRKTKQTSKQKPMSPCWAVEEEKGPRDRKTPRPG